MKSGVQIAEATSGNGNPGVKIVTGIVQAVAQAVAPALARKGEILT